MIRRLVPLAAALVCAVLVAVPLAAFLEHDACADAGGIYVAATGMCLLEPGASYVPQFARPGLYALWTSFLTLVAAPSWLAAWVTAHILARLSGRGSAPSQGAHEG